MAPPRSPKSMGAPRPPKVRAVPRRELRAT
jgi:hypothetical protein